MNYYNLKNYNLRDNKNGMSDAKKFIKFILKSHNDELKCKFIKAFDYSLNGDEKFAIINSIESLKIKLMILREYHEELKLSQICHIVMNIKNENEKNKFLKYYSLKMEDKIFDIVGRDFILNSEKQYFKNYIEFIFIIFTYVVAKKNNIELKRVIFNPKLEEEEKSGTCYKGIIEFCPLDYQYCDFDEYADFINTIYHEIEHEIQSSLISEKISTKNLNYRYLKIIKEKIIILNHSYYDIGNVNYFLESSEIDARINSYIKTFKFIHSYSKEKANLYLKYLRTEIILNRQLKNILIRLKCDEQKNIYDSKKFFESFNILDDENKIAMDDMFDSIPDIDKYLLQFPLLNLEYDLYGNKISDSEIMNRIRKCCLILDNEKYKECNLNMIFNLKCFYSNLLNNRNKVNKLKK